MADHAIWQVLQAYEALVIKATIAHRPTVCIDRDYAKDPFREAELPGIGIRAVIIPSAPTEYQGANEWRMTFMTDIITGPMSVLSINRKALEIAGDIEAALHDDRTLGGKTQPIEITTVGAIEQDGADIGMVSIELLAVFRTPRGDPFTLLQ